MSSLSVTIKAFLATRFFRSLLVTSLLPISLVVGTSLVSSRVVVEKLLTTMAMPMAMVWLVLWGLTVQVWFGGQKRLACVCFSVWICFSVATSPLTVYVLTHNLEKGFEELSLESCPKFDAIVALGGGTTETPGGRASLAGAGDRVILAARLYHAGKTRILVTTGEHILELRQDQKDGAAQTVEIWKGLGIPGDRIKSLGGRNTREEMEVISEWLEDQPIEGPIGMVTSAWHLPRAMRLATQRGLKVVPIPADYAAGKPPGHIVELLPSSGSFGKLEMVLKEYLARIVQR